MQHSSPGSGSIPVWKMPWNTGSTITKIKQVKLDNAAKISFLLLPKGIFQKGRVSLLHSKTFINWVKIRVNNAPVRAKLRSPVCPQITEKLARVLKAMAIHALPR